VGDERICSEPRPENVWVGGSPISRTDSKQGKIMRGLLGGIVVSGVLCVCVPLMRAAEPADNTAQPKDAKSGDQGTAQGGKRKEVVHTETPKHQMPLSYYAPAPRAGQERLPLVISYHGKGGSNEGEIASWVGLAEKHRFVVACPKSYFAGGVRPESDKRSLRPMREVEDALAVVAMLKGKYPIDEPSIMVTGFSGEALPSYTAGLLQPEVFRYVCSRCGNFPDQLVVAAKQQAETQPQILQRISSALKNSHFYFYYGEKDHPVILNRDGPMQSRYFENNQASHFKKEMVPGMGHDSRVDLAAEWFIKEIKRASVQPEKEDDRQR